MAPRKSKADDDTASTTSTDLPTPTPAVLKAKTEKAKVEKVKSEKAKVVKPKAAKKEKTDGEKEGKPKVVKKDDAAAAAVECGGKGVGGTKGEGGSIGGLVRGGKGDGGKGDGKVKEKVKPVNGEEAIELIARYLKEQNRPYSATEVSANLHGKVTKTVADKLLKEMEQNGQIKGKASKSGTGGQWVFWSIQDPADSATPQQLATMDTTITTLRDSLPTHKSTLKSLIGKLSTLRSAPTTADLAAAVERIKEENKAKIEKLRVLKEGGVKSVTTEEVELVERELKYWGAKRVSRKRAFEGLEAVLLDGMSREEIWEKVGVEGDVYR